MKALEVGTALVTLCAEGKFMNAIDKHYADNIVSIEGMTFPGMEKRVEGLEAVKRKNQWWIENNEVHSMAVEGPFVAEDSNHFLVHFTMDVTNKQTAQRHQGKEIGLYSVENGKVVQEEFYFLGS